MKLHVCVDLEEVYQPAGRFVLFFYFIILSHSIEMIWFDIIETFLLTFLYHTHNVNECLCEQMIPQINNLLLC